MYGERVKSHIFRAFFNIIHNASKLFTYKENPSSKKSFSKIIFPSRVGSTMVKAWLLAGRRADSLTALWITIQL